jgi:hypothetical protein
MIPSLRLLPSARSLKAGMLWRSSTAATEKIPAAGCVPDIRTNYSKAATPIWTKNFLNWTASFARRLFRTNRSCSPSKDEIRRGGLAEVILSVMGDATSIIIRTRLGLTCVAIASFVTTGSMCVTGKGKVTRIGLLIVGKQDLIKAALPGLPSWKCAKPHQPQRLTSGGVPVLPSLIPPQTSFDLLVHCLYTQRLTACEWPARSSDG